MRVVIIAEPAASEHFVLKQGMPFLDPAPPTQLDIDSTEFAFEFVIRTRPGEADNGPYDLTAWIPNPTGEGWQGPPMGLWQFEKVPAGSEYRLSADFGTLDKSTVSLTAGGTSFPLASSVVREDYRIWPRQSFGVAITGTEGAVYEIHRTDVVFSDARILEAHYSRRDHQDAYIPVEDHFGEAFHAARVDQARRLLTKLGVPGGRVLDAGSGYSLLSMATPTGGWPFKLVASDWDQAAMARMAREKPDEIWVAGGAVHLPFTDATFDVVFVGEVIEHLIDPDAGIREWVRVLRPGGHLVVTTPNRRHRMNRLLRSEAPENLEHLREYTPDELRRVLESNGVEVLTVEGLYLAALAYRLPGSEWVDPLRTKAGFTGKGRLLSACMRLGRRFPSQAYNLCAISRRH